MVRYWVLTLLLLSGCATPTWLGGSGSKEGKKESTQFHLPDPGHKTGLHQVWKRSLAGSPDTHFIHPPRIAVSSDAVFVGTFQGRVVRVNRRSGAVEWEFSAEVPIKGGVAVDEERVFAGTEQGEMLALSRLTGKLLWRTQVLTSVDSAPVVADGKVIFLTLDNHTYALDAVSGAQVWMHSTPTESLVVMGSATPTAAGGLVYIGYSSGEVFALSTTNGHRAWSDNLRVLGGSSELDLMQDVDASIVLSAQHGPQMTPQRAFVVSHQGRVISYFAASGSKVWERRMSAVRQPLWSTGRLFLSDMEGSVVAMSSDDGVELWRERISDGLLSAPVMFKDRLLVADDKERLFSMDSTSGRVVGMEKLSGPLMSLPVATEDGLFLWTNEGDLLRYE